MLKKFLMTTVAAGLMFSGVSAMAEEYSYDDAHEGAKTHAEAEMKAEMNLVEVAASKEMFSTLVAAVQAADLVDALSGEGPLTVFAPTNDAFAKLPEGTVEDLLKPENKDKLAAILKYHVLSGKVMAGDIAEGSTDVATLEGSSVAVAKSEDGVTVNGATVTKADVETSNGVIHVIDTVILPAE